MRQVKASIEDFSNCDNDLKRILTVIFQYSKLFINNRIKYISQVIYQYVTRCRPHRCPSGCAAAVTRDRDSARMPWTN